MSLIIDVPYAEKEKVKSLGAKWNPNLKKWYVEGKKKILSIMMMRYILLLIFSQSLLKL